MNLEHISTSEHQDGPPLPSASFDGPKLSLEQASALDEFREYAESERDFSEEERKMFAGHFLDAIHSTPGTYHENVGDLYQEISGPLVVRREDPVKALELLLAHKPLDIFYRKEFRSDEKAVEGTYYNAAMWNGPGSKVGLENAFIEGFSHLGGIVTVLGFEPEGLTFRPTEHTEMIRQTTTLNYTNNVSIEGEVEVGKVRFLVVRIPARYMPDDRLTDEELESKEEGELRFVFRGVSMKKPTKTND